MKRCLRMLWLVLPLAMPGSGLADESPMVGVKRLALPVVLQMAQAALDRCAAEGIQVGVTVVDRNGLPQAMLRDTLAPPVTLPVSRGKAYAAAMFNSPTSRLQAQSDSALGRIPGVVMFAGAVPVQVGGQLLGAIGVSGAPSGETDERCARAGLEAVLDDLEMAD